MAGGYNFSHKNPPAYKLTSGYWDYPGLHVCDKADNKPTHSFVNADGNFLLLYGPGIENIADIGRCESAY
jgi:hypothetical protein